MATIFTAQNPKLLDTNPELVNMPVASTMTWSKGALLIYKSSAVNLLGDGEIPTHMAASNIAVPTAGDLVPCYRLNIGSRMEVYTSSGGSAAAVGVANVGIAYDWEAIGSGASCVHYLELDSTTDAAAMVIDLAANYEPERNATADSPGKCVVEVMKVA